MLVSVLIPCFNAERYVAAAIESVLAQNYAPIEVIVVDDGSTDRTATVIEAFERRGVKIFRHRRGSAAAARNRAFAESSGDLVLFLDADDIVPPRHVQALAARLEPHSRAVAMGEWDRFRREITEARFPVRPSYRDASGSEWLCDEWLGGQPMTQCGTFLIPRNLIEDLGGWDEQLSLIDDFEFFARILSRSDGVRFAAGARIYYRSGLARSLSGKTSREAAQSACLSLLRGTGHLLAVENSARTRSASANMLQSFEYDFYPAYPDLRRKVRERIAELGGSDLAPIGPPGFQRLRRWIGWRGARRVQHLAQRIGLSRAARFGAEA